MTDPVEPVVFFDLGQTLVDSGGSPFPDALDILQVLHERGYRIGLLSNQPANTTVDQVYTKLTNWGFAQYIGRELVTISAEIPGNNGKPDKPIFDLALQKAGHPAAGNSSIFITEEISHIQAARSYGWRAILLKMTGSCQPGDGECARSLSNLANLLPVLGNMAKTNLHLAPEPKLVDGLWAVPVDISHITAKWVFDGSTSSATAEATLQFRTGRYAGNPVFDLRQTITEAWLDGAPLPVARIASHDFGGGTNAKLRVAEKVLDAGSSHTLLLKYSLGPPQSPAGGTYQPGITWSAGPRLNLNLGFTDLAPGRYLEAWIPANLIFDQYEITVDIEIKNTTIAHTLITNGTSTGSGPNHWMVTFPSRFTALSPLLQLHPSDTLTSMTGTVALPVSGKTVTIEASRFTSKPYTLATEINNLKTYLTDNENTTGPYLHNNRFVAFLHIGGMEYEGGTTSSPDNLCHETFHSWWARGVKPASQPDAWIDEGFTEYHLQGGAVPFDFTKAPVTLCSRNFYERITVMSAYDSGCDFWKGIAALIGTGPLNSLMAEYYNLNRGGFYTTRSVEEFLLSKTGNAQIVDAFQRFAYGMSDPVAAPDLYIRDAPLHDGSDLWGGEFWNSPDLWIRNADDGGLEHQNPEYGQDNWIYARVRNRGTATAGHFVVAFNVKAYAGVEFTYPADFIPCFAAASGFNLPPGESVIVKAKWQRKDVPPKDTHACLLAAVFTRADHPVAGRHVWEQNNLAQKNLTVVDLKPNWYITIPFVISNAITQIPRHVMLELVRQPPYQSLQANLVHTSLSPFAQSPAVQITPLPHIQAEQSQNNRIEILDCGGRLIRNDKGIGEPQYHISERSTVYPALFQKGYEAAFMQGATAHIPLNIRPKEQLLFGFRIKVPENAKPGEIIHLDLVERDDQLQEIYGGLAVEIHVI